MHSYFGNYLLPSPLLRELLILDALAESPRRTQAALAALVRLTPAMVNVYLARLEAKGLVAKEVIGRDGIYRVTEKGLEQREYHLISYSAELAALSEQARARYVHYFRALAAENVSRVAFYGVGETASVAGAALERVTGLRLVAVVDDDRGKQGRRFLGLKVAAPKTLTRVRPHVVVITSWRFASEIDARLTWAKRSGLAVRSLVSLVHASAGEAV